jgi:anti-sigma B factor antagonist
VTVVLEENMCLYVVDVDGDLRAPVSPELRHTIDALLARGERRIVLNLARLSDIDAAGIGELIRARDAAMAAGGILHIAHASGRVRQLLDIAGVLCLLGAEPVNSC